MICHHHHRLVAREQLAPPRTTIVNDMHHHHRLVAREQLAPPRTTYRLNKKQNETPLSNQNF